MFGEEGEILYDQDLRMLLLAAVTAPLGIGIVSPILDSLITPFETSTADIGLIISAFTAPSVIMIPVVGILADRYGRKPILIFALLLFGISGVAIAFTTDFNIVLGLRLLQGVAWGGLTPIIITSIGDLYDATAEATAQGFRFTCAGFSNMVFPFLSGLLVILGWQYPFFVYAMTVPIACVVYLYFEEPTSTTTDGAPRLDERGRKVKFQTTFALLRRRRVVAVILARGLPMAVWIGFLTYNSILIVQVKGGSPTAAGAFVAIASLVMALAASQAGRVTATYESRFYPLVGSHLLLGIGMTIFVLTPVLWTAAIGIAVVGFGFGIALSLYRSIITGLVGESHRGVLVSLSEAYGRLVSTLTPVLMGGIVSITVPIGGFELAVQAAGLGAAFTGGIVGIIFLTIARRSPPVGQPQ